MAAGDQVVPAVVVGRRRRPGRRTARLRIGRYAADLGRDGDPRGPDAASPADILKTGDLIEVRVDEDRRGRQALSA